VAAIVWPVSLPQTLEIGAQETRQPGLLRFDTDIGPPKQRRRFSATSRFFSGTMLMTAAQRATFETFYVTTSQQGSAAFDYIDPLDGSTQDFRFTAPPQFEALVGGAAGAALWRASVSLERVP